MKQNGNYTIDHAKIREELLIKTDYTCQGSELKQENVMFNEDHPEWLHMHHVNGRSGDNNLSNLKILYLVSSKTTYMKNYTCSKSEK